MARELTVRQLNARSAREHFAKPIELRMPGLIRETRDGRLIVTLEQAREYTRAGYNVTMSRDGEVCIVAPPRTRKASATVRVQSGMVKLGKGKSQPMTRTVNRHGKPVWNPPAIMASPVDEQIFYRKAGE